MTVEKTTLTNRLRVLNINLPDSLSTTIIIMVKAGSRYESKEENGIAHFIEHTIFKGSSSFPTAQKIAYEIELLGGQSNAFTTEEYTGYYIKCINENFVPAFDILSDIFINPTFDEKELEKEKGVVIEELKMYEDKPEVKVMENFQKGMFDDDVLGQPIGGMISNISNFSREMIFDFKNKLYTAQNIVVVIAGNQDKNIVNDKIKIFEQIKPSGKSYFIQSTGKFSTAESITKKDIAQTHLMYGSYGLKRNDPDLTKLLVATTVMGGGMGSELYLKLREELGIAYYVYSGIETFEDRGLVYVSAGVDSSRMSEAVDGIKKVIDTLIEKEISSDSLKRAKELIKTELTLDFESSDDIAEYLGKREVILGEYKLPTQIKHEIEQVTVEDVKNILQRLWTSTHLEVITTNKN